MQKGEVMMKIITKEENLSAVIDRKNMCIYQIVSTTKDIPDSGETVVYGLLVFTTQGLSESGSSRDFCLISDISDSFEKVQCIARALWENKVQPIHVRDIVEDML